MSNSEERSSRIAALNDEFRRHAGLVLARPSSVPGLCVMTSGVAGLARETQAEIFERVRQFSDFRSGNDPYGEHDFGAVSTTNGDGAYWKIDYYADQDMEFGADQPEDPSRSFRVLTIMLAAEY
jgi:Protein of unknown function (DUF3768)